MKSRLIVSYQVLLIIVLCCLINSIYTSVDIKCIKIKLCPMAMNLIHTRPYDTLVLNFLKHAHCGYEDEEPTIWCPIFSRCLTPDSKFGTCEYIKDCPSYMDLLTRVDIKDPTVAKYLRGFRCTTPYDHKLKVCCPKEKIDKEFPRFDFKGFTDKSSTTLPRSYNGECGLQNSDDRIFGGSETGLDEYPWMALIQYWNRGENKSACGGAVINERYILTAAHCVDPQILREAGLGEVSNIVVGEYDVRNYTDCITYVTDTSTTQYCAEPVQNFKAERIIIHPKFNSTSMVNDIALIRLDRKVKYSDFVQPICLPDKNFKLKGNENFTISGWGGTETERSSPVKLKARLPYSDKRKCVEKLRRDLVEGQLCVGDGNGVESCYGDSGGPLMLEQFVGNDFVNLAIGIISYGIGRGCRNTLEVYTFIPPYIDWITSEIN